MAKNITARRTTAAQKLLAAIIVPWRAFVAAFVYYTVLAVIAISVADLSVGFMVAAYLLPVVCYAGFVVGRGLRALATLPIEIGQTPEALLR